MAEAAVVAPTAPSPCAPSLPRTSGASCGGPIIPLSLFVPQKASWKIATNVLMLAQHEGFLKP